MKDKTALTARQKRFVEEYLACGDGPEAAIAAGYSPATAEERARELLRDPAVQRCRRESEQEKAEQVRVFVLRPDTHGKIADRHEGSSFRLGL